MKYPVGFWNYNRLGTRKHSYIRDWEDLGFTVPMTPLYDPDKDDIREMHALLDAAHEKGMKLIVSDKRAYWSVLAEKGEAAYRAGFADVLRDFGDRPSIYGFHVGDEPSPAQIGNACLAQSIQEEMSPRHNSFLNLLGADLKVGFGKHLDDYCRKSKAKILSYDCYTQMLPDDTGFETYFYNLLTYWQASIRNNISFWTTLLAIGHYNYRVPSFDDVRWQLSTAAAHGAKGVLWFHIYMNSPYFENYRQGAVNEHGRRTEVFHSIADNVKSFLDVFGETLMRLRLDHVWHHGRCYGGCPKFLSNTRTDSLSSTNGCPLILSYFTSDGNEDFIMLVNNSTTTSTYAKVALHGTRKIHMCSDNNELSEIKAGRHPLLEYANNLTVVGHWLSPGQAILFKYE